MSKDPNGVSPVGPSATKLQVKEAQEKPLKRSETKEAEAKLKQCRGTAN